MVVSAGTPDGPGSRRTSCSGVAVDSNFQIDVFWPPPAYKKLRKDKVKLPKRSNKQKYDDQSPLSGKKFVPETY